MSDNMSSPSPEKTSRFYYGYIVVAAASLIMMFSYGIYISFGLFFSPLLDEFDWSRAVTSGAYSLSSIISGVLGVVMGSLTDRVGPRIVVTVCGVLLGLGYLLMSQVNTVWQLYLFYGVIVGLGMSGCWVPLLTSVARWFESRRSLMTGIVISGLTIGQVIAPPVISRLITTYEWRQSYIIVGIAALAAVVLAAQFLRRDPGNQTRSPSRKALMDADTVGMSLWEAVRTAQFWMVSVVFLAFGFSAYGMTVHLVPHIIGLDIPEVTAANVLAVNGGIGIIGNFVLGGIIGDRIGNRKALIIGFILAIAALLWLVPARELWMLYLFAIVFGLGLGSMGTSESPLVARLFGLKYHGLVYAVTGLGFTAGGSIGPVVMGYIFDVTDSYRLAFVLCAILSGIGLLLMIALKPTRQLGTKL